MRATSHPSLHSLPTSIKEFVKIFLKRVLIPGRGCVGTSPSLASVAEEPLGVGKGFVLALVIPPNTFLVDALRGSDSQDCKKRVGVACAGVYCFPTRRGPEIKISL